MLHQIIPEHVTAVPFSGSALPSTTAASSVCHQNKKRTGEAVNTSTDNSSLVLLDRCAVVWHYSGVPASMVIHVCWSVALLDALWVVSGLGGEADDVFAREPIAPPPHTPRGIKNRRRYLDASLPLLKGESLQD